jgi:serine/threonine-protein kinase
MGGAFDPKDADRLFSAVERLGPVEIERILDRECRDAPELRAAVERLLADRQPPSAPRSDPESPTFVEPSSRRIISAGKPSPSSPTLARAELPDGARLGRYVILRHIAAGGMGDVYVAYDESLDRKVAIKLLRSSDFSEWSLRREAQALARLSHPNVVQVYDIGHHQGQPFVAMEFVSGVTLSEWLTSKVRPPNDILRMFIQCGRGLVAAHESGLVHRDFKPANVVVGDEGRARVLDFGIVTGPSVDPASSPDLDSLKAGTPQYMSPEQLIGEQATAASDQFSFCVSLYRALYGQRPFLGEKLAELQANVVGGKIQTPPSGKAPDWVTPILTRGLAREASARHPSLAALLSAIEARLPQSPGLDPNASRSARRLVAATIILVAAFLLAGARFLGMFATVTPRDLLVVPSAVLVITATGAIVFRKQILANRYGGQVCGVMFVVCATMLLHRLMALQLDLPIPHVLAVDMLVIACELSLAGLLLVRWFAACATPMFVGAIVATFFPHLAIVGMIASSFTALGLALLGTQKD